MGCGPWVRVLPDQVGTSLKNMASLVVVGMDVASTYPDGMWVSLGPTANFADIVAIEHCSCEQNFYDKRSRYMPTLHTRELRLPDGWLARAGPAVQHGESRTYRQLLESFPATAAGMQRIPLRHVRVLYALKPDHYDKFHLTPLSAHEFFCPHYALTQRTSSKLRSFIKSLSTDLHWYTQ
jgi:hypothetical protein